MADEEQRAQAEALRSAVVHDDSTYLKRISDDMTGLRRDFVKLFNYIDRAESRIPEDFRRLCMSFHDVHAVRNAYTEQGHQPPVYLDRIIELLNDAFKHAVEDLEKPGGAFYKARQNIVKRGDYRYDHSIPLLTAERKAQEATNETGTQPEHLPAEERTDGAQG